MTDLVLFETPLPKVARLVLNRADARNAQDTHLLYELNGAFDRAAQDDDISVVILAAAGPHFSAGHDMRERGLVANMQSHQTVGTWCGFGCAGAERQFAREREIYLGLSERWRNMPKPTIAEVQGKVIAGGLMLVWPCDIIVASEDATFMDNTLAMGVCGAEYFGHPWELGVRNAKELLFTADEISADEAFRMGMNPGGIRGGATFGFLFTPSGTEQPGEVTYGEAFTIQPFGNSLVTKTMLVSREPPRTSSTTLRANRARFTTAWPAELAAPTTYTSSPSTDANCDALAP